MKRYFFLSALIVFLFFPSTYVGAQEKIILGSVNYPPYAIKSPKNGLHGFDYDVISEAFKRMGILLEIRFLPWKRAIQQAQTGAITGVISCSKRDNFLTSSPISFATNALYVRKDFDIEKYNISSINDIAKHPNLSVGGVAGYSQMKKLDEIGKSYDSSPNDTTVFKKLFSGRIDSFLTIQEFADYTLSNLNLSHLTKKITFDKKEYYVCFNKSWPKIKVLNERFNKALKEIQEDGSFAAIHNKYK